MFICLSMNSRLLSCRVNFSRQSVYFAGDMELTRHESFSLLGNGNGFIQSTGALKRFFNYV